MQWNVSILAAPANPQNYLVGAIYAASNPSVLVQSIPLPKPYTGAAIQITFLNVNPIVYNFILFEGPTTAPSGIVRNTFSFQPTSTTTITRADLYITADNAGGPVSGQTAYVNATMIGWQYDLERENSGTMFPNVDYADDPSTGGWHLLRTGDLIGPGEKFVVRFQPQFATNTLTAVVNTFVAGKRIILTDTALTAADLGTALMIQGTTDHLTVTLPPLNTVQDFKMLYIYSRGGSHTNVNVIPAGPDLIFWGVNTKIILAQYEILRLFPNGGIWEVDYASPGVNNVGQVTFDYLATRLNTVEAAGQLLNRLQYSRLWAWVQTLDASSFINEAAVGNTSVINGITYFLNKGCYTNGDGTTTFRVPLLYNYGSVKIVNSGSRKAGTLQAGQVGAFDLIASGPKIPKAGNSNVIVAMGNVNDGSLGQQNVDLGIINPGLENYPSNVGLYGLIYI